MGLFEKLSFVFGQNFQKISLIIVRKNTLGRNPCFRDFDNFFYFFSFFMHDPQKLFFAIFSMSFECCQGDSVNCSYFRKDKMTTQGLFDPCACTSQDEFCTTELKKKNKQQGRQRQGRDGFSAQMSMSM